MCFSKNSITLWSLPPGGEGVKRSLTDEGAHERFCIRAGCYIKLDQSQWLFPLLPAMHTRAIASQRAINDRWRSAGWESLILPGLTAIRGDREGGRKLFPRTLSELCSGSSEGMVGFLAPIRLLFPRCPCTSILCSAKGRERATKHSKRETNFFVGRGLIFSI